MGIVLSIVITISCIAVYGAMPSDAFSMKSRDLARLKADKAKREFVISLFLHFYFNYSCSQ